MRAVVLMVAVVAVMNQLIDIVGDGKWSPAAVRRPFTRGMPYSGLSYTVRARVMWRDPYGDVAACAGAPSCPADRGFLLVRGCGVRLCVMIV